MTQEGISTLKHSLAISVFQQKDKHADQLQNLKMHIKIYNIITKRKDKMFNFQTKRKQVRLKTIKKKIKLYQPKRGQERRIKEKEYRESQAGRKQK